jgi:segregation and condensation protein B
MSDNESEKPKSESTREAEHLLDAANDWVPDSAPTADIEKATISPLDHAPLNPEGGNDYVSFIEDPFGIRTHEISQAQQIAEELELDEDLVGFSETEADSESESETAPLEALSPLELNQDDSALNNLAEAMAKEEQKVEAQLAVEDETSQADRDAQLAAQIAEDQALAAQMQAEQLAAEEALQMDPELQAALPKEPQPDAEGKLDLSELQSCIETLLFMMDKPVSHKKLQELLGPQFNEELFVQALEGLQARFASPHHGIELVQVANGWQFRTKAGRAALAKKLSRIQTQRLSSGGMETLAIIAYRQPVLKEEVDKIRGVDSSYFVRGLLDRKLIAITGRSELPGRPMLYSTTDHFLELFGLKDLAAMPSLREIEQMVPQSQSQNPDDPDSSDPRVREMRRLVGQMKADTSTTLLYDPKEDERILSDIRERVKAIPTSTPYLEEQKAAEKAASARSWTWMLPPSRCEAKACLRTIFGPKPWTFRHPSHSTSPSPARTTGDNRPERASLRSGAMLHRPTNMHMQRREPSRKDPSWLPKNASKRCWLRLASPHAAKPKS